MRKSLIPLVSALLVSTAVFDAVAQTSSRSTGDWKPGGYRVMPPTYGGNGFAHQTVYGPDGTYRFTYFPGTHGYGQPSYPYVNPYTAQWNAYQQDVYNIDQGIRALWQMLED